MNRITFFTRPDCTLCKSALYVIERVRAKCPFLLERIDISAEHHRKWLAAYRDDIPVVHLNGTEIFRHHVDEQRLRQFLKENATS